MRISDWSSDVCSSDLADRLLVRRPVDVGPVGEVRRLEEGRARSVESEMRVAGGRAIGNHRDRLGGRVSRPVEDLDVEDGGKPDRKRVVEGKSVSVRVDIGSSRNFK